MTSPGALAQLEFKVRLNGFHRRKPCLWDSGFAGIAALVRISSGIGALISACDSAPVS